MNNNRSFKSPLKFFAYSFILITGLFSIISCENFLQGEDVKEEIAKTIEYNNAPSYTINVEALKGTGIVKTPAGGEIEKKVTDVFPIRFEPEDSCKFIKWEAKFQSGESAADYVSFEDAESLETKVTFKKAPSSVIIIQPVCPPRLTYTFDLFDPDDPYKKYPKDSSIAFTFNKTLSSGCLTETNGVTPVATDFIAIQKLQPSEGSASTYFSVPEVSGQRLIFRSDSSFGYIPVNDGQRMISVTIPKDKIWYINEQYLSPVRVYLDSDITRTFYIGEETSAKTTIRYAVKQKEEKPIGTLKVTVDNITDEADDKPHDYSVGKLISLRYQLPEGYAFNQWKFLNSKGKEFDEEDLKFSVSVPEDEGSDRLILLNIIIDNSMTEEVTLVPEIYDPRIIEFAKPEENSGVFKVDNSTFTQEKQSNSYAVGKSFNFSYKVAEGYYFYDWSFKRTYEDENGNQKTDLIPKADLEKYGLNISYEEDADEKGYDKTTRIAQSTISIESYTEDIISITPICFEHLKVTDFSLDDAEKLYNRDSSIILTFNKPLVSTCKDNVTIRIPGLAEDKTFADYFDSFVLNQNKLTIYAKSGSVENLLPLGSDGTNTISIVANASDLYYEAQTSDGDKVNVSLASNIVYSYKINAQTETKTKIKYQLEESFPGSFKVDGEEAANKTSSYNVGQIASLRCKLNEGYSFFGWEFQRTYKDSQGVTKTEYITKQVLSDLGIEFTEDSEVGENGYDKATRIAQASFLLKKYTENVITVTPVCFENLKATSFNLSDAEKTYNRDSSIILTFNKPIAADCVDKISVLIPGLSEGKSWKDYFEEPVINGTSVTIKAKGSDIETLIPLGLDGTNTITILFNADDIYYEAYISSEEEPKKVYLASDVNKTYRINSTTTNKSYLDFQKDAVYQTVGNLTVNPRKDDSKYSIGDTIQLTYTLSKTERKDYKFENWDLSYKQSDEDINLDISNISELNLDFNPRIISDTSDAIVYGANVNVLNNTDKIITIRPKLIRIPDVTIKVDSGEHGISTPSGEITYKLNEINTVEFKSDPDYAFVRWQLININTNEELELDEKGNNAYIQSLSLNKEKFSFNVISVPEDNINLLLRPIVAERPQVISNSPLNTGLVNIDTTIKVMFDYDMDEHSIYYTDAELEQLRSILDLEDEDGSEDSENQLLYSVISGEKKYYGYRKTSDKKNTVYKNISIFNNKLNEDNNIIQYYSAPVFENPRTLAISVKKDSANNVELQEYTQIQINLDKNFFYSYENVPVTMSGSKKWIYQVNDHTDNTGPVISTKLFKIKGEEFTRSTTPSGINGNTITYPELNRYTPNDFNLELIITDQGEGESGPGSTFTLECTKLYDYNYKPVTTNNITNVGIDFDIVNEQKAKYNGNCAGLQSQLESGIYSVRLIARDNAGNETIYPSDDEADEPDKKWYLCLDKTGPNVRVPTFEELNEEGKIKLNWDASNATDYNNALIYYAANTSGTTGSSYQSWTTISENSATSKTLTNLVSGTKYRFYIYYYDKFSNSTGYGYYYYYTLPAKPMNVSVSTGYGTTPTITASKPTTGGCTSMRVRYREKTSSNNASWTTYGDISAGSSSGSITINNELSNGKVYEFEVCTYDSASGKYSLPFKDASGNYPTYTTIPATPTLTNVNYNNAQNSLTITYSAPNSDYTGIRFLYSKNSSFPTTSTTIKEVLKENAGSSCTITGLEAGTKYYVKVESYFINENNKATSPLAKSAYTMPDKASNGNNLYYDEVGLDYFSLWWDFYNTSTKRWQNSPLTGSYTGYEVQCKLSTASSYTTVATVPAASNSGYYYFGEDYDGTVITPGKAYTVRIVTYLDDTENGITLKNTAYAPTYQIQMDPVAPKNVRAIKNSKTSMTITWDKPLGYFDGYRILYSTSSSHSSVPNSQIINITDTSSSSLSRTLSGLTSEAYYYVWVETYVGTSYTTPVTYSYNDITRCSLALDAVSGLSSSANSSYPTTGINISWTNPSNTSGYDGIEIWRKLSGSSDSQYIKLITYSGTDKTKTSYTNTGLTPNTKYTYKVVTYKGTSSTASGAVKAENEISRTTYATKVTNFSATVQSDSKVSLTWSNPTNSNYYKQIKIYKGSSLVATLSKGTTQYDVTGLTGATLYTFYVKTTNDDNVVSTDYPSGIEKRTNTSAVSGLTTSGRTADSITLTWNAPSGNYTGYWARYKVSTSSSWTTLGYYSTNTLTKKDLSAGTKYDFDVQAYYVDSNSSYNWSSYTSLTSSTNGAKLTSFKVSGQYSTSLYLTWTNLNANNYDYVRIWYKKASGGSWNYVDITKGNTGYTLAADPGCRYQLQAIAYFNGYGTYTDVVMTQTKPNTPTNFAVTSTDGVVKATWTPPSGEQSYTLGYKKSGGSWNYVNIAAGNSSYTFGTDINNSSEYSFYMWSKMDNVDYGNAVTSVNTPTLTYITPPPRLPGVKVGAGTSSWVLTIDNWDSVKSMIPYVNVFVDGVYQGGVFNSTTGKITLSGSNWENKTITVVPYHCNNSNHGKESLATEPVYNGGNVQYKTLTTWNNETYGKRFSIYRLDVANYR